jgi:hypothetical protein
MAFDHVEKLLDRHMLVDAAHTGDFEAMNREARERALRLPQAVELRVDPAQRVSNSSRPSVVGRCTSIICTAANFSNTLRGVSLGASACRRRASVT